MEFNDFILVGAVVFVLFFLFIRTGKVLARFMVGFLNNHVSNNMTYLKWSLRRRR